MAKKLNVNLAFSADTGNAKTEIQALQTQLTNLINTASTKGNFSLNTDLQQSTEAAIKLKTQLQSATNVKTGNLNLTKFTQELDKSGMNLEKYRIALENLGPEGTETFSKLAQAITTAEVPIANVNSKLAEFATTLKNTARWQISSSIMHGFMGSLQSAYNYAQNLDRSLNDIRIVTGQSSEQMAEFAERANQAAKELRTTTTAYTNASLIYYQQGLSDEEVKERTDTTIKMANVTGENATAVSDYMTAIWNNFDDGSVSLEHYADVITALGAATASSSEEIAGGLEKFASIADTVGLSYDYATTALATIVAQTRQSEDTVGTGLRTILSRFSNVTLGETLEDGVDLTKYTQALKTIGVDVLDNNGELKTMDEILDSIGENWQNISDTQKTALAQTVGGVRQYTTIMSLFDNWDVFKENLSVAQGAEGSLQEQADIYAESWQAAQKRVRASMEAIYQDLLDDKFFIAMNNGFAGFLDIIDKTIDSLGGLKGVLLLVGSIVTRVFQKQIGESISNSINSIKMLTESGKQRVENNRREALNQLTKSAIDTATHEGEVLGIGYKEQAKLQNAYLDNAVKMSEEEKNIAKILLEQQQILTNNVKLKGQLTDKAEDNATKSNRAIQMIPGGIGAENLEKVKDLAKTTGTLDKLKESVLSIDLSKGLDFSKTGNLGKAEQQLIHFQNILTKIKEETDIDLSQIKIDGKNAQTVEKFETVLNEIRETGKATENQIKELDLAIIEFDRSSLLAAGEVEEFGINLEKELITSETSEEEKIKIKNAIDNLKNSYYELGSAIADLRIEEQGLEERTNSTVNTFEKMGNQNLSLGQSFSAIASTFMSLSLAVSSVKGLFDTWSDSETSLGNKLISTFTTLGMVIPSVTMAMQANNAENLTYIKTQIASSAATGVATLKNAAETGSIWAKVAAKTAELAVTHPLITAGIALAGVITALILLHDKDAEKLENLKDKYDATTEAAQETKSAFDDMSSAKSSLDSLIDTLNGCTKGTQEWKEALFNVNQQILDIINKYPELAKYVSNEEGQLSIAEEGWDELLTKQKDAANAAAIAQAQANIDYKTELARQTSEDLAAETHNQKYKTEYRTDNYGNQYTIKTKAESYGNLSQQQLDALTEIYTENSALFDKEHNEDILKALEEKGIELDSEDLEGFLNNKMDLLAKNQENLIQVTEAQTAKITAEDAAYTSKLSDYNVVGETANIAAKILEVNNKDNYSSAYKDISALTDEALETKLKETLGYETLEGTKFEDFQDDDELKQTVIDILATTQSINSLTEDQVNEAAKVATTAEAKSTYGFLSTGVMAMKDEDYDAISKKYNTDENEEWSSDEVEKFLMTAYGLDSETQETAKSKLSEVAKNNGYETSSEMIEAMQEGLNKGKEQLSTNYYGQLYEKNTEMKSNQISANDLDADVVNTQAENIIKYGKSVDYNTEALEDYGNAAVQMAINNQMMDKGVQALSEDWETWKKTLKSSDKTTKDYAETVTKVSDALQDMLNISDDSSLKDVIDADFINDHLGEIEKAAKGDEEAIQSLGQAVAVDYVDSLKDVVSANQELEALALKSQDLSQTDYDAQISKINEVYENQTKNIENVKKSMNELTDSINAGSLKAGDSLTQLSNFDTKKFVDNLNQMAIDTGMSVSDMQSMLNSLHLDAVITTTEQVQTTKVPIYETDEYVDTKAGEQEVTVGLDGNGDPIKATLPLTKKYTKTHITGYENVDEVIQVPQIAFNDNGKGTGAAPIKYLGRGSVSPSSTSSGSRSSGSRRSSPERRSATKKTTEDMKKADEETERYHVLNNQLEDLEHQLNKISTAKDRAFGKNRLKYIDQEIKKYDQLIDKDKEYLAEVEKNLKKDKAAIQAYGAVFDENGTITNYEALMQSQINKSNSAYQQYNKQVDYYNSLSGSAQEKLDEQYEKKKDAEGNYYSGYEDYLEKTYIDPADKAYDKFLEILEQYEETQDLYKEKSEQLAEDLRAKYDLELEGVEYEIEVKVMIEDDALEYLDYLLKKVEDDAHETAEAIALLGDETQSYIAKSQLNESGIQKIFANHGLTDEDFAKFKAGDQATLDKIGNMEFTDDEVQAMRDYRSEIISLNETLIDTRNTIHDKVRDAFAEFNDELDEGINKIDTFKSITQSYLNIVDLVGQKNLGISNEILNNMGQSVVNQANNKLKATVDARDAIEAERDAAQKALEESRAKGYDEDVKQWEQTLKEMDEALLEAEQNVLSAWEDALTAANEAFENSVQLAINSLNTALGGLYANADELSEAFDRQKDLDDQYLEDFEQIYELTKLTREINKAIDDTDNIKGKQELAELLAEINELEERREELGENISEYDLEYLQKKLELKKAEIAMEDSQNAKSQVRMSRTYDGTWSYVYTANEEEVAAAEQSYEDKLYEMQRLNADYINTLQDNIVQMQTEMVNKLQEIATDESLSIEERQEKMDEVQAYYKEKMDYYTSEMGKVMDNNKELYNEDWQEYSVAHDYKIADDQRYVDSFNETALSTLSGYETMEQFQENFNNSIGAPGQSGTYLDDLDQAFKTWEDNTEEIMNNAGTSMEDFSNTMQEEVQILEDKSDEAADSVSEMSQVVVDDMQEIIDAVMNWENQYSNTVDLILTKNEALVKSFNSVLQAWAGYKQGTGTSEADETTKNSSSESSSGSGSGSSKSGTGDGKLAIGDKVTFLSGSYFYDSYGTNPSGSKYHGKQVYITNLKTDGRKKPIHISTGTSLGNGDLGWVTKDQISGYDTGGYTGSWGDDGKLALLHEKELVLNKDDTENFLKIVGMVRQIAQVIDLNAGAASSFSLSGLVANAVSGNAQTLQQEIHINAEFPNATDRDEIKAAFESLAISASQYANRNRGL